MAPPDVSIYFAAQRSMSLAAFVKFAFMMVLARDLSLAKAGRDIQHFQDKVTRASTWTFWLMVPAVLITIAAGYPLLSMFGPEFTSGYPIMLVLAIGFLFQAVIGQGAGSDDHPRPPAHEHRHRHWQHRPERDPVHCPGAAFSASWASPLQPPQPMACAPSSTLSRSGACTACGCLPEMPRIERLRGALAGSAKAAPPAAE